MNGQVTISLEDFEDLRETSRLFRNMNNMLKRCLMFDNPNKKNKKVIDIQMTGEIKAYLVGQYIEEYEFIDELEALDL